jgi:ribosome-associated protein
MQFIGKLMRKLPAESVAEIEAALDEQRRPSAKATLALHLAEEWRDRLMADDDAFTQWLELDPQADVQQLRALIRQARKDAQAAIEKPGEAQRHGKAYRELFQAVRTTLGRKNEPDQAVEPTTDSPTDTDAE